MTATNAAGTATASSNQLGATHLSLNAIKKALRFMVVLPRQAAKSLLKNGMYPRRLKAPEAGKLTISWYLASTQGHSAQTETKRAVATGATKLRGVSSATINIKLTGEARVIASKTFTLRLSVYHKH